MKGFVNGLIVVVLLLAGLVGAAAGQDLPPERQFGLPLGVTASDGASGDGFGFAVALDGATAVIGASGADAGEEFAQGAAYVFAFEGGDWSEEQKLLAGDGASDDEFGYSLAVSGETALVGALFADVGDALDQGAAYVFRRSGGAWSEQQKLVAPDGEGDAWFGAAVAIAGDTAVVGAPLADAPGAAAQGAVYVFTRSGNAWSEQQKLVPDDGLDGDSFGWAVAISGETILVGAPVADVGDALDQGAAYVFRRSGNNWSQQRKLVAADGAEDDNFGSAVALENDTAIIGAGAADIGENPDQGAAYVFSRSGNNWSQQQKLAAADGASDDWFGYYAVSLSGNTAVIGADWADIEGNLDQGAAYVFARRDDVWIEEQKLAADDGAADDTFGVATAVSGALAVVGANGADVGEAPNQGKAYFFSAQPAGPGVYLPVVLGQ